MLSSLAVLEVDSRLMTISFTVQLFNTLFVYLNDGTTVVLEAVRFCHTPVSVYGRLSLSVKNCELIYNV